MSEYGSEVEDVVPDSSKLANDSLRAFELTERDLLIRPAGINESLYPSKFPLALRLMNTPISPLG